jgi:endonuclease III
VSPIRDASKAFRRLAGRYPTTMLGTWGGERINPFHMLVGTILSARSRDEMTDVICRRLFKRYPTPKALAGARRPELERLLHSIGFYRQKARYIVETSRLLLAKYGGRVPETMEQLLEFPGVGRKVANCVLVYAFGTSAIPVDTHVHRLSNRLGWVRTKNPEETERELVRLIPRRQWMLVNELMVAHGKAVCRPIGPRCGECPIEAMCAKRGVRR